MNELPKGGTIYSHERTVSPLGYAVQNRLLLAQGAIFLFISQPQVTAKRKVKD